MIIELTESDLDAALNVIRESFATVAREFDLNERTFPQHNSMMKPERLRYRFDNAYRMYGYISENSLIGFVSLHIIVNNVYELNTLSVIPAHRHNNYGTELLEFCKEKVREWGGEKIVISLIDAHEILKSWYELNGFTYTGAKKVDGVPFTVGYMECAVR